MNVCDLTESQLKILVYLGGIASSSRRPPTVREVAVDVFDSSWAQAAYFHLGKLREKGYLAWSSRAKRDLRLTPAGERILREIAGATAAETHSEDAYRFVQRTYPKATHELFRVPDNAMDRLGILEGDWVVIRRQESAGRGEVVLARVFDLEMRDWATVLRCFAPDGEERARLSPLSNNPEYAPIRLTPERPWQIVGVYAGLCREDPMLVPERWLPSDADNRVLQDAGGAFHGGEASDGA